MTMSPDRQRADRRLVLTTMMEQAGEDPVWTWEFDFREDFPDILPSVFRELSDDGFIEVAKQGFEGLLRYRLTAAGWFEALRIDDRLNSPEMRERGQRLMAHLKRLSDSCQGPADDALFESESVPGDAGFSGGWACNAIESGLLAWLFPNHRVNAYADLRDRTCFNVPPNFGRKIVDRE